MYVTGETLSEDFPTTPGAYDRNINNDGVGLYIDGFLTRLNAAGTDLVYSTYLGWPTTPPPS